jgi:predicted dehydrogenase
MLTKVRWGVTGSGGIARRRTIPEGIIPARNAELMAVFDINSKVNADVARKFKSEASGSVARRKVVDIIYTMAEGDLADGLGKMWQGRSLF